ncbi:ABC transporter permease [Saccharopolyspora sp. K220]|uniref:ABC transporter permease n=1 Tax=Saccharopolyspora soli TaxID=2926618 RepID=UPI001F55ABD6|nr:ABC transporter permease [Saccharopolyspora soli]MCI2417399.1 ABC transporter permease [Saccharopolyspora soli]
MSDTTESAQLTATRPSEQVVSTSAGSPRARKAWRRVGIAAFRLTPFVLILALWAAGSALGRLDPLVIPAPSRVAAALWDELFINGSMWTDIASTMYRVVVGLVLGVVVGVLIGVLMGQSRVLSHLLDPLISFTFPMPKLALLPLLILWLGIGEPSKIAMVLLGTFFPMAVNTYTGVTGVNRVLVWNARTLGASRRQILWTVVLPSVTPHILSGIRVATGISFVLVVAAEMISANDGLGYSIVFWQRNFRPDIMLAGILVTAVLGFVLDRLISRASSRLLAWQDSSAL